MNMLYSYVFLPVAEKYCQNVKLKKGFFKKYLQPCPIWSIDLPKMCKLMIQVVDREHKLFDLDLVGRGKTCFIWICVN